ncbi:hypothetical protein OU787_32590 [Kitasatospora sp. YST-16]|nr:hypothetical protein [Kitasatospora sp. YST-16]WAL75867.1 hypothetical protein OU787_32590 [Kitasatospora sp. YST-16]WNW41928.1 hypothetical protein RKE32_32505 [Streptomyces sp. Li-HN-5-13]
MTPDLDSLATALYVETDDERRWLRHARTNLRHLYSVPARPA